MSDENEKPEPPDGSEPKLRWYQYSLKSLLIFMLISGLFFGWCGKKVMEARKQKEVVAWVKENGGEVYYDNTPLGPEWLRGLIGIDYLYNVEGVDLYGAKVTDLSPLSGLSNLRWLVLNYSQVTDFSPLAKLTNLEVLYLDDTKVTSLSPLVGLTKMYILKLKGTPVTKEDVQKLKKSLPNCEIEWDGK